MPLLRINATAQGLALHGTGQPAAPALERLGQHGSPVVIMVHGFKYTPQVARRCPHGRLFRADAWPLALGVGAVSEGKPPLSGVAFGWHARGGLRTAFDTALDAARDLAAAIAALRGRGSPAGPVHIIAHSLGATVALAALPYLRPHDVGRIVLLSGAAHKGLATHALRTPAGQTAQLCHITSHENSLFDLAFEQLIAGSGAIGRGIALPNARMLRIDCPRTLAQLADLGYPLAPPARRICHWSSYTRGGVMALNRALLTGDLPMQGLAAALARPQTALAPPRKTAIMGAVAT